MPKRFVLMRHPLIFPARWTDQGLIGSKRVYSKN